MSKAEDHEVEELASMVAEGQISTMELEDALQGGEHDDIEVTDEQLDQGAQLNAKLRAMERDLDRKEAAAAAPHRAPRSRNKAHPTRPGAATRQPTVQSLAEQRKIEKDNLTLLAKLQRIQNQGSSLRPHPAPPVKVKSAASINRYKKQQAVERENLQFLKRLQGVKSTMSTGGPAPHHRRTVVAKNKSPRQPAKPKPQWVDLSGGMYL
eukprot:m.29681 g.29681  ORF g.29681 m.29681 type:complete len:209 (-) comp4618_c0_seq1:229-855(-)